LAAFAGNNLLQYQKPNYTKAYYNVNNAHSTQNLKIINIHECRCM